MISEFEADFLSTALSEVPPRDPTEDIEFTEKDIQDFRSRISSSPDDSSNIRRFFKDSGYEVCQDCGSEPVDCSCDTPELREIYFLDTEHIVEQWCQLVEQINLYDEAFINEEAEPFLEVKAVSREFGVITFSVVSDTDQLVELDPSISDKRLVVSLVESTEVTERDHHFMWYELSSTADHENLNSEIRDTITLLSKGVCSLSSEASSDNINAIHENLQKYMTSNGFEPVDVQREAGGAGEVLDFTKVDFAGKGENGVVVICGCDKSARDVHLHYIVDGDLLPVSDCKIAKNAASRMRQRITRLETLRQNSYELSGRMRAAILAAGAVSLGPLISSVSGLLNLTGVDLSGYPVSPGFFISGLLLLIFLMLLLPSAQLTFFSWDLRSRRTRARDRIPF